LILGQRGLNRLSELRIQLGLSFAAREELHREQDEPLHDIGIDSAIREGLAWIGRAQENSLSSDGGVAHHYCLITGWSTSYPETTGYIIPTMIREAEISGDMRLWERARRMLDWLVSIQMPGGGFQGGPIGYRYVVPVTFNTGQILIGLAAGASKLGSTYGKAMISAADWMLRAQDADGCWRKHSTPFARGGEKAYEVHAAWGLLEAARLEPDRGYAEAALRNMNWALSQQNSAGWFANCCLSDRHRPLTHTLGYAVRGLLAGYEFSGEQKLLAGARKAADGLLTALQSDGFLPGRLDSQWRGTVAWACLTGTAQIAACWFLLHRATGKEEYLKAALLANRYVRSRVRLTGPPETRGAVKGSFPIAGQYAKFQYPNWACKFLIDSNRLEAEVNEGQREFAPAHYSRTASPVY